MNVDTLKDPNMPLPIQEFVTLARAPLRVSLAGGGTDLPSYSTRFGGMVISAAINRYVSITVFPRSFDGTVRLSGYDTETVTSPHMLRNTYIRSALSRTGCSGNIQIAICSDAPAGTGLGGSGAFTVALLHALRNTSDRVALAEEAGAIEIEDLARPVGKHDHYMAAFGGFRVLRFTRDGHVLVEELQVSSSMRDYIDNRLLLFYTGYSRDAGSVLSEQDLRMRSNDSRTRSSLDSIAGIAETLLECIAHDTPNAIGPLLHQHWLSKLSLSVGVTNPRIDELYRLCRDAGSDGGKLLGAGGGGFLLISVPKDRREDVIEVMTRQGVKHLSFGLDTSGSNVARIPL